MEDRIEISWRYSPRWYLGPPGRLDAAEGTLSLGDGVITFRSAQTAPQGVTPRCLAVKWIEALFDARLVGGTAYEWKPEQGQVRVTRGGATRLQITDSWEILESTAVVRVNRTTGVTANVRATPMTGWESKIASLYKKHDSHPVVRRVRAIQRRAVLEPHNRLVHLFELEDLLNGEIRPLLQAAGRSLPRDLSLDALGRAANDKTIATSRHRGQFAGPHRELTAEEEIQVERDVRTLIETILGAVDALDGCQADQAE